MSWIERIGGANVGTLSFSEPLARHCTWRIGGPADVLAEPGTEEEIARLVAFAGEEGVPLVVVGRGSNLLFCDEGVRGIVLKLGRRFSDLTIEGQAVRAQGGLWVPRLARRLASAGLSGFEHAAGIPGSLGGLITMNGGSLRKSVGDNVVSVFALSLAGERRTFRRDECAFSYRRSRFQDPVGAPGETWIVLGASLVFPRGDRRAIRRETLAVLAERRGKFPLRQPNCGSVFTNDPAVYELAGPPGRIVEETGLKGLQMGGVQVSPRHANFMVNVGEATARDVLTLVSEVRRRVHDRIGVWIECEVRHVDEGGRIAPVSPICEGGEQR
mgnify:FL=1